MPPWTGKGPRQSLSLRFCLGLIRVAGTLVPRERRPSWKAQ